MASREGDGSRYLRSTISNIAFLVAIGYFVHEKALSETSLVTVVTLFIGGYFGTRMYANKTEADMAASVSNPRMPAVRPPNEPPSGGVDIYTKPTREFASPERKDPRVEEPSERGRWGNTKRLITNHSLAVVPVGLALAGLFLYMLIYIAVKEFNFVAGIG